MSESDLNKYALELCEELLKKYRKILEGIDEGDTMYHPNKVYRLDKELEKYWRIIETEHDGTGGDFTHIFIDKETGDIYGQDGAVTPTKTTRFNLLDSDSRNAALHFADVQCWFVSDEWENADEEIKKQIAIAKALASLE